MECGFNVIFTNKVGSLIYTNIRSLTFQGLTYRFPTAAGSFAANYCAIVFPFNLTNRI